MRHVNVAFSSPALRTRAAHPFLSMNDCMASTRLGLTGSSRSRQKLVKLSRASRYDCLARCLAERRLPAQLAAAGALAAAAADALAVVMAGMLAACAPQKGISDSSITSMPAAGAMVWTAGADFTWELES